MNLLKILKKIVKFPLLLLLKGVEKDVEKWGLKPNPLGLNDKDKEIK